MRRLNPGFTLVQLLVGLVVGSTVAAAALRASWEGARLGRRLGAAVQRDAMVRTAALVVDAALRDLTTGLDTDLRRIDSHAVTYRALQSLNVVCVDTPVDVSAERMEVVVAAEEDGLRPIATDTDSALVWAPGPAWWHADVLGTRHGRRCPGREPSRTIMLRRPSAIALDSVRRGTPVRGFTIQEIRSYRDRRGRWWLGMRRADKYGGFRSGPQPVVGPLAPDGFTLTFLDRHGAVTHDPTRVSTLQVQLVAAPVEGGAPADTLAWSIALRP